MTQQNQNQQQININPEDTTGVACVKCSTEFFIPVYMLRKVSAIISPSGKEETIQVPVMACAQCGTPMVPEGFDKKTEEEASPEGIGEAQGDGSRIIT